jgi:hypothetical protein
MKTLLPTEAVNKPENELFFDGYVKDVVSPD